MRSKYAGAQERIQNATFNKTNLSYRPERNMCTVYLVFELFSYDSIYVYK